MICKPETLYFTGGKCVPCRQRNTEAQHPWGQQTSFPTEGKQTLEGHRTWKLLLGNLIGISRASNSGVTTTERVNRH